MLCTNSAKKKRQLRISAADGEEGYPGNLAAEVKYTIEPPGLLRMEASATTDAPTIVNLAQHTYFNLDDSPDILGHHVQVFADHYTPTDANLIPTGEIAPVDGTPYDLRMEAPIGRDVEGRRFVYDINFAAGRERADLPRRLARLRAPHNGMVLDVASAGGPTGPMVDAASSRRSSRTAPTIPASRRRCSARAKRIARTRS